jgi:membrane dipeptidase
VNSNRRNVTDEQAKAVAEKGGLIGVIFSASFLGAGVKKPIEALSVDDVMDHVDHLVKLIGIDHVAFGSDFSAKKGAARNELYIQKHPGVAPFAGLKPNDLNEMPKLVNIAKGMVARGYSDQEIQKFLGLNWIKVWERVWK